ncbi:hypothetical protein BDZ91DRAFT_660661 [Kalaharituber pfeilii]|nr:hypothetical protein BDZ91DRAFT_660661 [Kalaharituber pfeilii]
MGFYELAKVESPFDPSNRFESSYILGSYVLAGYRLLISLYCFVTLIFRLAYESDEAGQSFSYFTNLSYWGLAFYFLFSGYHTFQYARYAQAPLQKWPRLLQFLHSLYYSTIVLFPFVVTAVYWALLAPDEWFPVVYQAWSNVSVHAMNALFAFLEIVLSRAGPMPWIHIPFLIVFLGGYLGVAYITYATQGFYTYSFLDPKKDGPGIVAAYICGIVVGICVLFAVVWGIQWVKIWFFEDVLGISRLRYVHGGLRRKERLPGGFESKSAP